MPLAFFKDRSNSKSDKCITFILTDLAVFAFLIALLIGVWWLQTSTYAVSNTNYVQSHLEYISNPLYKRENMTILINLNSTTFSAHNPVSAYVTLYSNTNQWGEEKFIEDPAFHALLFKNITYTIDFQGTYCENSRFNFTQNPYSVIPHCGFHLIEDGPTWNGSLSLMRYSTGGEFDIALYNETISYAAFAAGNVSMVGHGFIPISPVDATNSFKEAEHTHNTWRFTATVTIIAAFVGSVALYQRVRRTLLEVLTHYSICHKHDSKTDKQSPYG